MGKLELMDLLGDAITMLSIALIFVSSYYFWIIFKRSKRAFMVLGLLAKLSLSESVLIRDRKTSSGIKMVLNHRIVWCYQVLMTALLLLNAATVSGVTSFPPIISQILQQPTTVWLLRPGGPPQCWLRSKSTPPTKLHQFWGYVLEIESWFPGLLPMIGPCLPRIPRNLKGQFFSSENKLF